MLRSEQHQSCTCAWHIFRYFPTVLFDWLTRFCSSEPHDMQTKKGEIQTQSSARSKRWLHTRSCKSCSSELDPCAKICEVCGDLQASVESNGCTRSVSAFGRSRMGVGGSVESSSSSGSSSHLSRNDAKVAVTHSVYLWPRPEHLWIGQREIKIRDSLGNPKVVVVPMLSPADCDCLLL